MRAESFAKVNLTLEVGEERGDGYHEIESILQTISLSDRLEVERAREIRVTCDDPAVPDGEKNIAFAAARLLQSEYGIQEGCAVRISKGIPAAAGLGGGSGNAAAVLALLSKLWGLGLSQEKLMELGGRLGSDVPFFFVGGTAICRGRGEIVEPLPPIPASVRLLLVTPGVEISSSFAYKELSRLGLTKNSAFSRIGDVSEYRLDSDRLGETLFNRLEESVLPDYPLVKATIEQVARICHSGAIMSGSGPSVFGILGSDEELSGEELTSQFDGSRKVAVVHPVSCGFSLEDSSVT